MATNRDRKGVFTVQKAADLPAGEHFVVIEFGTVSEDTGYGPENTSKRVTTDMKVFPDRQSWEEYIVQRSKIGRLGASYGHEEAEWVPCILRVPQLVTEVRVVIGD